MGNMLPELDAPGWRKGKFWPEITALAATLVGSLVAGIKLMPEKVICPPCPPPQTWTGFWFALGAFVATGVAGYFRVEQALAKDKEEAPVKGPAALVGCLHVLHGALLGSKGLDPDTKGAVRVTVHKVISDKEIQQLVPYVGGDGGEPGRTLGHYGVVGRAILTRKTTAMIREGTEPKEHLAKYLEDLTTTWFVPKSKVNDMRHDRMSFVAVPLLDSRNEPVGAVFLDAENPDFFDEPAMNCVLNGCAGIVEFLKLSSGARS